MKIIHLREDDHTKTESHSIPIGACLVGADGKIIGAGRNQRVQKGSATLHVCSDMLSISIPFVYSFRTSCYCYRFSS